MFLTANWKKGMRKGRPHERPSRPSHQREGLLIQLPLQAAPTPSLLLMKGRVGVVLFRDRQGSVLPEGRLSTALISACGQTLPLPSSEGKKEGSLPFDAAERRRKHPAHTIVEVCGQECCFLLVDGSLLRAGIEPSTTPFLSLPTPSINWGRE